MAIALNASAAAHPGHGNAGGDFSALHYLIEPVHVVTAIPLLLLLVLCGGYFTGRLRTRARRRT